MRSSGSCALCAQVREIRGKGLCCSCYMREWWRVHGAERNEALREQRMRAEDDAEMTEVGLQECYQNACGWRAMLRFKKALQAIDAQGDRKSNISH